MWDGAAYAQYAWKVFKIKRKAVTHTEYKNCSGLIELHAHLDGSITPEIAEELSVISGVSLPKDIRKLSEILSVSENCGNLSYFLRSFELPLKLLQTYESLALAVRLVSDRMARDGVIYVELRFAPQLHTRCGMSQEDAVCAALDGLRQCCIPTNLILCMMRGEKNIAANEETLRIAEKYVVRDGGVVALDLAGDEAAYPTRLYAPILSRASSSGIPLTVHAGEAGELSDLETAIRSGCKRIGHGVRIDGADELISEAICRGITFELCPTSNRITGAVKYMSEYPLSRFIDRGLQVALCTDDPAILGITLGHEYFYAEEKLGLTLERRRAVQRNAICGAFTSEERKASLINIINI